jgi:hypothetical protein
MRLVAGRFYLNWRHLVSVSNEEVHLIVLAQGDPCSTTS